MSDSTQNAEPPFFGDAYRELADSLPICLALKDLDGRIMFANRKFLEIENKKLDEMVGKNEHDLYPPELADAYRADDLRVVTSGEAVHDEEKYQSPEGDRRWIERIKSPVRNAKHEIIGVQLLFWDVTRRREAEAALAHERFLLNALLENVPDSIYFKDLNSQFLRVSRSLAEKFDLPNVEAVEGLTDADVFSKEHAEKALADEQEIVATGEPIVGRVERETWHDQGDTWCSSTKMPLHDESGKIVGTFGISRDITELKHTEAELRRARDEANAASQSRSEFVANMSHEIRTPMNGIIGMAELLSDTKLAAEQREYLGMIQQSANSLLTLLNDILDFSKVESGKLRLESIPFDLSDCVGKTVQTMAIRAAEKRIELACRVAPELPERLVGDPGRFRQVIVNLVGNAIKFTDRGEVVVDVETEKRDNGDVMLHVRVRDTGIGIPKKQQERIFAAFNQADASTTRRFGGTGLGLTISSELVDMMGGKIWVESEVGRGSTFHFTAMFQVAKEQPKTIEHLDSLTGLKTLVVDDNETNRRILTEILSSWKVEPKIAVGGVSAFAELSRAARDDEPYELLLLDCMMPGMDGFALAELVMENADLPTPTMIMISSAARPEDPQRCVELGIYRHMTKPVVKSELYNTIVESIGLRTDTEPPTPEELRHDPRSLQVLLVEDGVINQQVALGLLERAGHRVSVVGDGQEAVAAFRDQEFDVILMDLQMPVMDGITATRLIRELEGATDDHVRIEYPLSVTGRKRLPPFEIKSST